ncbi:hypothetical protein D9619_001778 [Psilocybe cf. subviscida]|uniref:Transcriptional coactivator p15 (PC4) C-terminal domain-containing protein n=1 Tax=Psilocybe cf. subviscida TaxID=2480587 RepID=A0A8H5BGD2_9AGAR|nr:hypothetical protein D9619_001778 [Psilocybe cf. subviscida]
MPKRKEVEGSEEDFSAGNSDQHESDSASSREEVSLKSKKKKQDKARAPANKKAKSDPVASEGSSSKKQRSAEGGKVKVNTEGDKYIDLGKKKRAVVRSFKGMALIDIREYYGADGDEKPGKKGISLTPEQWNSLKESSSEIDALLSELQKKK